MYHIVAKLQHVEQVLELDLQVLGLDLEQVVSCFSERVRDAFCRALV